MPLKWHRASVRQRERRSRAPATDHTRLSTRVYTPASCMVIVARLPAILSYRILSNCGLRPANRNYPASPRAYRFARLTESHHFTDH